MDFYYGLTLSQRNIIELFSSSIFNGISILGFPFKIHLAFQRDKFNQPEYPNIFELKEFDIGKFQHFRGRTLCYRIYSTLHEFGLVDVRCSLRWTYKLLKSNIQEKLSVKSHHYTCNKSENCHNCSKNKQILFELINWSGFNPWKVTFQFSITSPLFRNVKKREFLKRYF